jgi:hypothetical protein
MKFQMGFVVILTPEELGRANFGVDRIRRRANNWEWDDYFEAQPGGQYRNQLQLTFRRRYWFAFLSKGAHKDRV